MDIIANDGSSIRSDKWTHEQPNWSMMVCGDWAPINGHSVKINQTGGILLVVVPGNVSQSGVRLGAGATPRLTDEDAAAS
jgi:hypothetical protein